MSNCAMEMCTEALASGAPQADVRHLLTLLVLVLGLSCFGAYADDSSTGQAALPNIIYILADDMGYGDMGANNPESKIPTPNLDTLAAEGMRFTDAHSPSSVCTPTRYSILTGEYPWRSQRLKTGVLRGYGHAMIETGRVTVAGMLKGAGYKTAVIGKWHLGLDWKIKPSFQEQFAALLPDEQGNMVVKETDPDWIDFSQPPTGGPLALGFDYSFILPASLDMPPYAYLENDVLTEIPSVWDGGNDLDTQATKAFWRAGHKAPGFIYDQVLPTFTRRAVRFIEENAEGDKPFFLYLPLTAPHTPWLPTRAFQNRSKAGMYGDFVNMVDDAVGQVLQAINKTGEASNTLVIFTSDNGPWWGPEHVAEFDHRAAGIYRGMKTDVFEGGHRVPFIVKWPGKVSENTVTSHLTDQTNLMATLAEILGSDLPQGAAKDSVSILPILLEEETPPSVKAGGVVNQSARNMLAIRVVDWKFIDGLGSGGFSEPRYEEEVPGGPAGQLYNLAEDPGETENLYLERPDIVQSLKQRLQDKKLE